MALAAVAVHGDVHFIQQGCAVVACGPCRWWQVVPDLVQAVAEGQDSGTSGAGEGLGPEGLATGKLGPGLGHCLQRGLPAGFPAQPEDRRTRSSRRIARARPPHRCDAARVDPHRRQRLAGASRTWSPPASGVRLIRPHLLRLKLPDRTHDAITAAWRPSAAQPRPPAPRGCDARQARQAGHRTDHPRLPTGRATGLARVRRAPSTVVRIFSRHGGDHDIAGRDDRASGRGHDGECQRRAGQAAASERPASQAGNRRERLSPVACRDGMASHQGTGLIVD